MRVLYKLSFWTRLQFRESNLLRFPRQLPPTPATPLILPAVMLAVRCHDELDRFHAPGSVIVPAVLCRVGVTERGAVVAAVHSFTSASQELQQ